MDRTVAKSLAKGSAWGLGSTLASLVLERLVVFPALYHALSRDGFASFVLVRSVVLVADVFASNGVYHVLLRSFASRGVEGERGFFRDATVVTAGLAVGTCVLLGVLALVGQTFGMELRPDLLGAFLPYVVFHSIGTTWQAKLRAELKFGHVAVMNLLLASGYVVALPLARVVGDIAAPMAYSLSSLVFLGLGLTFAARGVLAEPHGTAERLRKIAVIQLPFSLTGVTLVLGQNLDRIVLAALLGLSPLPAYFVAQNAAFIFSAPTEAASASLLAVLASGPGVKPGGFLGARMAGIVVGAMVVTWVAGWFLGPWLIRILYGPTALDGAEVVFQAVLAGVTANVASSLLRPFILLFGGVSDAFRYNGWSLVLGFIVMVALGSRLGTTGVALGVTTHLVTRALLISRAALRLRLSQDPPRDP